MISRQGKSYKFFNSEIGLSEEIFLAERAESQRVIKVNLSVF
jgi:hypothetical protein